MKKQFDWERFKTENIAVHCKTEEEAKDFCRELHERGTRWFCGDDYLKYMNYDKYKEKTCYYSNGEYSRLEFAKGNGYEILEWSDYMQKEFTKADLKDLMVVKYRNGEMFLKFGEKLVNYKDFEELSAFDNNLKDVGFSSDYDIMKIYKLNLTRLYCLEDIFNIENLELIWERKETKHMTAEEMRQKLEELTGEKIEVEPSREEMIGACYEFCNKRECMRSCVLSDIGNCVFKKYSNEQLKQCYEKVMKDGRKES